MCRKMKWNESGFRPPLCTYKPNWARITSWGWWDDWDDTRNSNPGGQRPSTLPLGRGGSQQYWLSHVDGEETFFVSFKTPRPGTEPRTLAWKAAVQTTTLGPPPCMCMIIRMLMSVVFILYICHLAPPYQVRKTLSCCTKELWGQRSGRATLTSYILSIPSNNIIFIFIAINIFIIILATYCH